MTRCQVNAEVPEVATQQATNKSPIRMPTELFPGEPTPQPVKKPAASISEWIWVLLYVHKLPPEAKPKSNIFLTGFDDDEYAIVSYLACCAFPIGAFLLPFWHRLFVISLCAC
ncbi:hypothetical protein D9M71_715430 [compost metagenome]